MNTRVAAMLERYGPPIIGGIVILLVWEFVPAIFNVSKLLLRRHPRSQIAVAYL